jgi:hypothetical protein
MLNNNENTSIGLTAFFLITIFVIIIAAFATIGPIYGVWEQSKAGEAMLAKAEYAKKAQIADAEAKYESSKYLRQAAEEIQSSLTPEYLQFLRTQAMEHISETNDRAVYFFDSSVGNIAPLIQALKK